MIQNHPSAPKILVILHQEHSTPARVGRLLQEQGCNLDIRRPRYGDPLPDTMRDHAGAVIFGGPMCANDADDYIKTEIDWINVPLAEDKPFLGICLGAQMMAKTLGGRVYKHPEGRVEIGYYPISPHADAASLCCEPLPGHVYQWHRDGFDLPAGAKLLATGGDFEVQACKVGGKAYGIQFHPEVTYAQMCRWTTTAAERMGGPGAQPREAHLEGWFRYDAAVDRWARAFLARWVAG